jgi:hypothetical protein
MNLDIQWFIYALVSNELVTVDDCMQIYEQLGTPDLGTYAQAILDAIAQSMSEEEAQSLCDQIQTVIDFAVQQAQTGEIPEIFAPPAPEISFDDLPSLEGIDQMSDQEVADLMCAL